MVLAISRSEAEKTAVVRTATRIALVVEYDGTGYYGSQLQADHPTVQSALEKALKRLTCERVRVSMASRTDTGVHARGQVVSLRTDAMLPMQAFIHGLNHYLPEDIAVRSAHTVPLAFNPRRMAASREYAYTILNSATRSPLTARFAHRIAANLDCRAMDRACKTLVGVHDFASFASEIGGEPEKSTVRHVLRADVTKNGDLIVFTIVANAFVRHQIRSTAGALAQVGLGKLSQGDFARLLESKQPGLAGPTLPACGLCLERVNYPCTFEEMRR